MYFYLLYAFFVSLAVLAIVKTYKLVASHGRFSSILLLVLLIGLLYSYLLLGFGTLIRDSSFLLKLSKIRYLLLGMLSPFTVVIGTRIAQRFNTPLFREKRIVVTAWIFTLLLIALGIKFYFVADMAVAWYYGHIRFEPVTQQELYLISATIGFILLFISLLIYAQQHYAFLFGVVLVVLIGFALMRLLVGSKIVLINDMLDMFLLLGLYKAEKHSLLYAESKKNVQ